ncbi:RNA 3'-terminal phosphate cyclase [Patescibacteria group bacterium]|nr:RNA 3'-terminal phosphate cyclase [Patescibacteria group bacterium]
MIEVDGSIGEAGGQILRTACALSAVTKKPCRIFNIRRGRPNPGLRLQHLLGIQALAKLCNGRLEGDFLGSEEIKFWPGEIKTKDLHIKIETAGSITLVLQTLILPSLFASPSTSSGQAELIKIVFNGGATDTFFSPTIDHFQYVFLEVLEKMIPTQTHSEKCSRCVDVDVIKKGYYPEGGAKVEVKIRPSKLKGLNLLERGSLKKITVMSGASEFLRNKKVTERQIAGVREVLGKLKLAVEEKVEYYKTQCPGSQICLIAEFENTVIGTDNLGKLGKRAEDVGKEAALELLKEQKTQACLDKHLADQILPYLVLAKGKSEIFVSEITNHCKTNIWVIEKFIEGKFKVEGNLIQRIPA